LTLTTSKRSEVETDELRHAVSAAVVQGRAAQMLLLASGRMDGVVEKLRYTMGSITVDHNTCIIP
jgi:hypothetical protein